MAKHKEIQLELKGDRMNAQEMFEKLGYELSGNCGGLTYRKKDKVVGDFVVRFIKDYKLVSLYNSKTVGTKTESFTQTIHIPLYKAIQQQMKELGWLE